MAFPCPQPPPLHQSRRIPRSALLLVVNLDAGYPALGTDALDGGSHRFAVVGDHTVSRANLSAAPGADGIRDVRAGSRHRHGIAGGFLDLHSATLDRKTVANRYWSAARRCS